jgi:hypothetical protein
MATSLKFFDLDRNHLANCDAFPKQGVATEVAKVLETAEQGQVPKQPVMPAAVGLFASQVP